jgi:NAD(P)-dependent dehydrogenase (short-subunit alcohol dehydrogenase family)
VKAILDEMLARAIAEQLRERGHDVIAVTEAPALRALADDELFAHAQQEQRAIVTRNRDDFLRLDAECQSSGASHHGLVFTNRLPEPGIGAHVSSLDAFLAQDPPYESFVHWLEPA